MVHSDTIEPAFGGRSAPTPVARARLIPTASLGLFIATMALGEEVGPTPDPLRHWRPDRRAAQQEIETALLGLPSAASLAATHELVSSRPHVAGTPGDLEVVDSLARSFERLGLEVEKHEFWAYLPRPISASLEIVSRHHRRGRFCQLRHTRRLRAPG